jgi:hypothetical protein
MAARKFLWPAALYPHDYEGLHYLIAEANAATGVNYRIAYTATKGTPIGANYLTSGLALLYNSARLRNITRAGPNPLLPAEDTPSITGFHARKSWPCKEPHQANYRPVVVGSAALPVFSSRPPGWCAPPESIWSDHCAVFVQFEPGPA